MEKANDHRVGATVRSFKIIETLMELDGAGVSELARHLDMPKSTVHDYLHTLHTLDYLVKQNGEYRIGARFLELGGYTRDGMKLYHVAKSEIQKLAETTGEHANLMIEEHGYGIFLFKSTGQNAVELDTYVGMRVHLHTTALGKAILAHLSKNELKRVLDEHGLPNATPNTITDEETLRKELQRTRERGYAIDDEERIDGMRCIAAPIRDSSGSPIGAASISAPIGRMEGDLFTEEFPRQVMGTANVIEVNITYS